MRYDYALKNHKDVDNHMVDVTYVSEMRQEKIDETQAYTQSENEEKMLTELHILSIQRQYMIPS